MTISYNWLINYLPQDVQALDAITRPEQIAQILTAIGLEVESLHRYESIKGGLSGVLIGKVLTCDPHPNADKLKITTVDIGLPAALQVVCGASNVAAGQTVAVATVGAEIYPVNGDPITIKTAKIRGTESQGMICAEDEIGIGTSHDGIMVLPDDLAAGTPAAEYFKPYSDWIFEIGLTPNHMDAMSHYGVARDICAYLSHHVTPTHAVLPAVDDFATVASQHPIQVVVENTKDCPRYAGVSITGITVGASPEWLKNSLLAIGQRPINNIVDITNFVLHETGQPLHAFDQAAITGNTIVVKNVPAGTEFITLDEKPRKLNGEELMICNAQEAMCIAGVFGGIKSGVHANTKNIFLESAWFHPVSVRKTSVYHGLRTDAATHFEKGVDIAQTVYALKRAALLIQDIAGGTITGDVIDVYPHPQSRTAVRIEYDYLKKLSGKLYPATAVKNILQSLGFTITSEDAKGLLVSVPYHKPDISIPADIVEEILRIDGLDNVAMPGTITIAPAIDQQGFAHALKEKLAGFLVGKGCTEILTNSITYSGYFSEASLEHTVKMVNSLSAELDVMRPSMLETGLATIAYNLNRKNQHLQLFELGKIYTTTSVGHYTEQEQLCLYFTGDRQEGGWRSQPLPHDIYSVKGGVTALLATVGIADIRFVMSAANNQAMEIFTGKKVLGTIQEVAKKKRQTFDIKQPVFFVELDMAAVLSAAASHAIVYKEVQKFPSMQRDLSMVVDSSTRYAEIEVLVEKLKLPRLQGMRLFDVFESDKLGAGKKSVAISFTFIDEEKTLTDKETDQMIAKIIQAFERELNAEIRKS